MWLLVHLEAGEHALVIEKLSLTIEENSVRASLVSDHARILAVEVLTRSDDVGKQDSIPRGMPSLPVISTDS